MTDFDKYYVAKEPGYRERALGWATAIGLQDVDGLTPSKYLIATAKRNIEGEITAAEARNLVDAYYETKSDHDIPERSEEADKVAARINQIIHAPAFRFSPEFLIGLLFGYDIELKNRFLRIGQEYGSETANAIAGLHRDDKRLDVSVNVGVNVALNSTEEVVVKEILRNNHISAVGLSEVLGVSKRQAERVISSLKKKTGLRRKGADKNGEWCFER